MAATRVDATGPSDRRTVPAGRPARPSASRSARPAARVHPLAWWAWALGVAVALSATTHPVLVTLLLGAVVAVVLARRDDSPWARAFPAYLVLGAAIVVLRVVFTLVFGLGGSGPVVLDLPVVTLPAWVRGVEVLGPFHLTSLLAAVTEGLRLAALVVCFGAANALADPKRALRALPASLHPLGTAVVIAVTVTPQLVSSVLRVRRAQRLRGAGGRGPRAAAARLMPVLQDALDHALALAASMDSRGYARAATPGGDRRVGWALVVALAAAVVGTYALLDTTAPRWLGLPVLAVGAVVAVQASRVAGRQVRRSRYRPDRWRRTETLVAGAGAVAAGAVVLAAAGGADLTPPAGSLAWSVPALGLVAVAAALVPMAVGHLVSRPARGSR